MTNSDPLDILMIIILAAIPIILVRRALKRRKIPPFSSEDQRIGEIGMELYRRLNVKSPPKMVVFWNDPPLNKSVSLLPYRSSWPDYCFIQPNLFGPSTIELAKCMKERLEPEEWRPLMAASLIFKAKKGKMVVRYTFTRFLLPEILAVVAVLVFFETALLLPELHITVGMFTAVAAVLLFGVLFFGLSSLGGCIKKMLLMADVQAAELVGKEALLHTLRKIDDLGLGDLERLKGSGLKARFRRWHRPSVPERIENLLTPKLTT